MADKKCPYCYRTIGENAIWHRDPVLLPNGAKYDWVDDEETELQEMGEDRWYKGFYQINIQEVKELQDYLKSLEEDLLIEADRTDFTEFNSTGKFQILGIHIKEMRESIEKMIGITSGTTPDERAALMIQFFNYDEEGNHIIHPNGDKSEWTDYITPDKITDWNKFQIKAIHIEDLRHVLLSEMEKFSLSTVGIINTGYPDYGTFNGDIGFKTDIITDRPWDTVLVPLNTTIAVPSYASPIQDPGGMWYSPGISHTDVNVKVETQAEIKNVSGNKYLTAYAITQGYNVLSQYYPNPLGWYPIGSYFWYGGVHWYCPRAAIDFIGRWKRTRPEITANKIFTFDLKCQGARNYVNITYPLYPSGSSGYSSIQIPFFRLRIYLADTPSGSFLNAHQEEYLISDITSLIDDTFTVDLWNLYVLTHPTIKYLEHIEITLEVGEIINGSAAPFIGSFPATSEVEYGNLYLHKLDNIGLKRR